MVGYFPVDWDSVGRDKTEERAGDKDAALVWIGYKVNDEGEPCSDD